jgi:hypothetical protein
MNSSKHAHSSDIVTICKTLLLFTLLLLATSCAVPYKKAMDTFLASETCCESMADFKYRQLPKNDVIDFKIDEQLKGVGDK